MRRAWMAIGLAVVLGSTFSGCGDSNDPDDAGNQLVITSVTPEAGKEGFVFPAVDQTEDEGCDGDPAILDGDGTQNNSWPDVVTNPNCLESRTKSLDNPADDWGTDLVDIALRNEPRPGVDPGRPLQVTAIQITYFFPDGTTPAFAPQRTIGWAAEVPDDGTVTLEGVPLTTVNMKVGSPGVPGLRDLFAIDGQGPIQMNGYLTVFAEDDLNDKGVEASTQFAITFVNPNPAN